MPPPFPFTQFPSLFSKTSHTTSCHSHLSYPSTFSSTLTSGLIPAPFKRATVTPFLKKPALVSADIWNYWPVSLCSFLSKILECEVRNQLYSCLSQNDLLHPNQSGFRTAHSTEMALLTVTKSLHTASASSHSSVLILHNLSSAFDTVNKLHVMSQTRNYMTIWCHRAINNVVRCNVTDLLNQKVGLSHLKIDFMYKVEWLY